VEAVPELEASRGYDRARYYGGRRAADPDGFPEPVRACRQEAPPVRSPRFQDSPDSPETLQAPTRDAWVREIPVEERRLPPGLEERGGWVEVRGPEQQADRAAEGEEEDLDEDLLYLRLIALRSLANEREEEEKQQPAEVRSEMLELLEEAAAASAPATGGSNGLSNSLKTRCPCSSTAKLTGWLTWVAEYH
jgi:hypothetical protein